MNNQVVIQANLIGQALFFLRYQLVVLNREMMILYEGFSFEIQRRHMLSPNQEVVN